MEKKYRRLNLRRRSTFKRNCFFIYVGSTTRVLLYIYIYLSTVYLQHSILK